MHIVELLHARAAGGLIEAHVAGGPDVIYGGGAEQRGAEAAARIDPEAEALLAVGVGVIDYDLGGVPGAVVSATAVPAGITSLSVPSAWRLTKWALPSAALTVTAR